MIVTDVKYSIEKLKVQKLDLMAKRVSGKKKLQNVIGCDGQEGFGKSTITAGDAYYLSHKLKRPLLLFFDIEKLIEHALTHKDHIYIWDDAALAALSMESYNSIIIKFIKTVLLARKNRHTYFINIQEIWRLKEPIVSRMIGLTHVYSADELTVGRFAYYRKDALLNMYNNWQRSKKKAYGKYKTFMGTFPDILYKIFDEQEYEGLKDKAILSIMDEKKPSNKKITNKMIRIVDAIKKMAQYMKLSQNELSKIVGVPRKTINDWFNHKFDEDERDVLLGGMRKANSSYNKGYIEPITQYYKKYCNQSNNKKQKVPAHYNEQYQGLDMHFNTAPIINRDGRILSNLG